MVGGQHALGRLCGVRQQIVWKWLRMARLPAERAVQIDIATGGKVTVADLRPDFAALLKSAGYVRKVADPAHGVNPQKSLPTSREAT